MKITFFLYLQPFFCINQIEKKKVQNYLYHNLHSALEQTNKKGMLVSAVFAASDSNKEKLLPAK